MKCHVTQNCPKSQTSSLNLNVSIKSPKDNWVRKSSKIYVRKSLIRTLPHLRKVRIKKNWSPKICGFVMCGIYLRTTLLCVYERGNSVHYIINLSYRILLTACEIMSRTQEAHWLAAFWVEIKPKGTTEPPNMVVTPPPPPLSPTILVKPAGYRRSNHSFHTRQLNTELIIGATVKYFT